MARVLVLGAGMVGSLIARDLARDVDLDVTVVDARQEVLDRLVTLEPRIVTRRDDLSRPGAVRAAAEEFDQVCGALASGIGAQALSEVIDAGVNYCDISFMPQNALELDARAKEQGVAAVVDCGVAPGMSNLIAGAGVNRLDRCDSILILVGGLPRVRRRPFEYKAAFSPADVIEEYTRPARYVEGGRIVIREALSEPELVDLPGVDTLEAFNTDGLRTLIDTLDIPNMKEKTLRYPGHIELMRVFRETGLFRKDEVEIGGASIRPLDMTSALLFPKWMYEDGEEDLTVMRVVVSGDRAGCAHRLIWDVLDFYDPAQRATSMARTTAFPCAIVARLLLAGRITKTGVLPPELLSDDDSIVTTVLEELASRGVRYQHTEESTAGG